MTREELIAAIRENKMKPADLFDKDTLAGDPLVTEIVKAEKQTEYEHAKRVEKRLGEEREGRLAEEKKHQEEMVKLRGDLVKTTKTPVFQTLAAERKLDERQKKFVENHLAEFSADATDDAGLRTALTTWMDDELAKYASLAELFGVKESAGAEDKPGMGAPPADGKAAPANTKDLTDPKNNPLIPE